MALMLLGSIVTSDSFLDKKTIFCSFLNTKWLSVWDPYTDLYSSAYRKNFVGGAEHNLPE